MTGQDIITEARVTLMDEDATDYRFADTLLLGYLNDGQQALYSKRRDCVLLDTDEVITSDPPVDLAALDETIAMETKWRAPLVWYVLWRTYDTENDEHQQGAKGMALGFKARFDEGAKAL